MLWKLSLACIRCTCAVAIWLLTTMIGTAAASTVNVLWYDFSGSGSGYESSMLGLASTAGWNVTFFHPGDNPTFSNYNVLVTQSIDFSGVDYSGILNHGAAIQAALGNRTVITGQDADWHYINFPGPVLNGPEGFLLNAINWAGSGTGLGVVALADGCFSSGWFLQPGSFLSSTLAGDVVYGASICGHDNITITDPVHPLNVGLTSAGLSNWGGSTHLGFISPPSGYSAISQSDNLDVTLVSSVPEPGTLVLMGTSLLGVLRVLRRRNTLG